MAKMKAKAVMAAAVLAPELERLNDGYDGSKWSREEHQLDALSPGDHRSAKSKLGAERARPPVHFDSTLDR